MARPVDDIEIWTDEPDRPLTELRRIDAKVGAATVFSKSPTIEDVNFKLREQAARLGADAVIHVVYSRGVSATSWKGLKASGLAAVFKSDETTCPYCAETIKAAAIRCKHCGADLAAA